LSALKEELLRSLLLEKAKFQEKSLLKKRDFCVVKIKAAIVLENNSTNKINNLKETQNPLALTGI